jgi:hypothetical protein
MRVFELLVFLPSLLCSRDLELIFRSNILRYSWNSSPAIGNGPVLSICCTSYHNGNALEDQLKEFSLYYPILSSLSHNRICYLIQQQKHDSPLHLNKYEQKVLDLHFYSIPSQYQLDHSILLLLQPEYQTIEMDLELTFGIGIPGHGRDQQEFHDHEKVIEKIVALSEKTLLNSHLLGSHLKKFVHLDDSAGIKGWIHKLDTKFISTLQHLHQLPPDSCQFNQFTFHSLTSSHVSISLPSNTTFTSLPFELSNRNICYLFVASIAVLFHEVAYLAAVPRPTQLVDTPHVVDLTQSIPVDTPGINYTDQNAWIQSGTIDNSPYSDMGILGEGYVLGIIDSGISPRQS